MSKRAVLLGVLLCAALAFETWAQPAIPEVRFRVLYKANNAPVQWLFVEIYCERKLGWSERRKTGNEYQKTYSSFGFYPTQNGWVTLPSIEAPGTTEYEVTARAPASGSINYPYSYSGGKASWPFNEVTLPRFLKMREASRVLYAEYASDYYWGVPTQQTSYEGISYALDALKLLLQEWPKLDCTVTQDCSPTYMHDSGFREAPYHKRLYFTQLHKWAYFRPRDIAEYETCANQESSEAKKAETHTKAQELRARLREILCKDLADKKMKWGSLDPPSKLLDEPFLKEAQCEALKEFYKGPASAQPEAPSPKPAAGSPVPDQGK